MDQHQLLIIVSVTLVTSPALAALAAILLRRHLRAVPGEGRRWVPALPGRPAATGRPARRFDAAVRKAEKRAVKLLLADTTATTIRGVEATELAVRLGVPAEVTTALLDDWRARLPCRLRVTRAGRLLHDVPREAVAKAVGSGWHAWPQRLLLFGAAIVANVGATWWLIVGVASATVSLGAVWAADDQESRVWAALAGVIVLAVVFGLAQLGAWLVRLLLWGFRPRMAPARLGAVDDEGPTPDSPTAPTEHGRSGGLDLSGVDLDLGSGGCGAVVLILCVAVLSTAVIGGLTIVFVWLRGLWRTVRRLGEPEVHLSPAEWLSQARRASTLERWLPTNDLAVRMVRALSRALAGRPADGRLAARVRSRAQRQGGRVAAIEVSIDEGLSPSDALSVLARLIARHGGDLQVSDAGDIDAVFDAAVAQARPTGDDAKPRRMEYLPTLAKQPRDHSAVGVNLPGLTRDHLDAATRLAGGPLITLLAMLVALLFAPAELPAPAGELGLLAVFCLLVPGTLVLTVATRAVTAETARQGLLRDVRDAAIQAVKTQLIAEKSSATPSPLLPEFVARELRGAMRTLVPSWGEATLRLEVEAAWADLGLGSHLSGETIAERWEVAPLAARLKSLARLRAESLRPAAETDGGVAVVHGGDEVIFDSDAA